MMKESENTGVDTENFNDDGDAEKGDESGRKNMKRENDGVNQSQNTSTIDSFVPTEAAIKVGRIPLIWQNLLKSMKNRDLVQNCRLVSREWRDFSTTILHWRKTFQVEFNRDEGAEKFTVRCSKLYKIWNLTQLTTFLTTSKTFPCAHFIFNGNLKSADAQEFLTGFGSRVKGIKLIGHQNLNCIRKLLVEQIPHVKSLELSKFEAEGSANPNLNLPQNPQIPIPVTTRIFPENSPVPQLSSLKFLKLGKGNSPELIQEILNAAPNLEECFGIRLAEEIQWFRQPHRLDIIKGLKLKPGKDKSPSKVENILSMMTILLENSPADPLYTQLHLTDLQVNYSELFLLYNFFSETRARFCSIVSKLLAVSQTTLKTFKFAPDSNFAGLIEWSTLELENVEKLTLEGDLIREFARIFQPSLSKGSNIFPNLHTLSLNDFKIQTDEHLSMFKNVPPIPTVKNLVVSGAHAQIIKVFARLLPNVVHLFIRTPREPGGSNFSVPWPKIARVIWQLMRELKSLQVEFDCPAAEIDAGFTGMEIETCKLIRTLGGVQDRFRIEEIHKFRLIPSILNLAELEALFLPGGFTEDENPKYNQERGANCGGRHDAEFNKASFISFKYAFKLMPKLRVFPGADY